MLRIYVIFLLSCGHPPYQGGHGEAEGGLISGNISHAGESFIYNTLDAIINASPTINDKNMTVSSLFVPGGAALNSFQINTPQNAPTIVAP